MKIDWIKASSSKRAAYVELQLEYLESSVSDTRRAAQGRLLYLLQGENCHHHVYVGSDI
jgi:hypothetical protein